MSRDRFTKDDGAFREPTDAGIRRVVDNFFYSFLRKSTIGEYRRS